MYWGTQFEVRDAAFYVSKITFLIIPGAPSLWGRSYFSLLPVDTYTVVLRGKDTISYEPYTWAVISWITWIWSFAAAIVEIKLGEVMRHQKPVLSSKYSMKSTVLSYEGFCRQETEIEQPPMLKSDTVNT